MLYVLTRLQIDNAFLLALSTFDIEQIISHDNCDNSLRTTTAYESLKLHARARARAHLCL